MNKNNVLTDKDTDTATADHRRVASIARALLGHLEQAIALYDKAGAGQYEGLHESYERMFGAKHSYVDALVDISGLLLKLNTAADIGKTHEGAAHIVEIKEQDLFLIEEFVRGQKAQRVPEN